MEDYFKEWGDRAKEMRHEKRAISSNNIAIASLIVSVIALLVSLFK